MNIKIIKKISIDKLNFYDLDGTLDIDSRVLNLTVPFDLLESIFNLIVLNW